MCSHFRVVRRSQGLPGPRSTLTRTRIQVSVPDKGTSGRVFVGPLGKYRHVTEWIPLVGGLATALIGALAVTVKARGDMATKGSWERIMLLIEISEKLPEGNLRSRLDQYRDVLVRGALLSSTRVRARWFLLLFVPGGILALTGSGIGLAGVIADDAAMESIAMSLFWTGFVVMLLALFVPMAPQLPPGAPRRKANSELIEFRRQVLEDFPNIECEKGLSIASDVLAAMRR